MFNNYRWRYMVSLFLMVSASSAYAQDGKPDKPIKKGIDKQVRFEANQARMTDVDQLFKTHLNTREQDELRVKRAFVDKLGFEHTRYQQFYKGIKVEFGAYIVHSKDGVVSSMNGDFKEVKEVNTTPSLSSEAAFGSALSHVGAKEYLWQDSQNARVINYEKPQGELVILDSRLAYKFDVYATKPLYRADVYIDAQSGEFIMENKRIHHANTPATGTSLYNGTVSFTADSYTGGYRLRQTADGNGIETYDLNNGTNYNNASDITSSSTSFTGNATGVQAHYGAEQTYKYFFQEHGRNSYNGSGAVIRSYVSYSTNYVNAFWDGSRMTYGDGDGTNYGPLVSLDICGHEVTHGVTEYTSNLVYSYESGAMNESLSDIFGESIEQFATGSNDWIMGDDIGAGGSGGAIRSLSNPNAFSDPDTYKGSFWYSGSGDNGGVHTNSGVMNHWFYILSVGKSGTNDNGDAYSVTGIGIAKAQQIAYRMNATYFTSNSNYNDARQYGIQAAIDLYGADSPEHIATQNAWYAVGLGNEYGNSTPPTCATGTVTLTLVFDNYPEETSWTLTNSSGTTVASGGTYGSEPDGSTLTETFNLAAGDYTFTINDSYGDGICCSYGNGSYTLTDNGSGETLASGGSFGSSDQANICVDGGGSADTEAPTAPGSLVASGITSSSATLTWNASTDNVGVTGYDVYLGGSLVNSTTSTSYNLTGLAATTSYTASVRAKDAAGNTSTASTVTFTTDSGGTPVTYCASQGNNVTDEWIDLVSLGSINNATGANGGYGDFTSLSTDLARGNSYTINFSAGFASTSYTEYWSVWVDFNQDGDFNDSGEQVATGSSSSSATLSGTVAVPASAALGSTRMRVSMKYNSAPSSCGSFTYGEVEDYTVNITNTFAGVATLGGDSNAEPLGNEVPKPYFVAHPNPAKEVVEIAISEEARGYDLKMMTLNGVVVKDIKSTDANVRINMANLPQGVYILSMKTAREVVNTKIIKE
ncbi:M4 family metallopeptidase [Fulvivirga sp. 29W222]|uniref:M4 family metallopeptidase n=1 Tax=Fulvivirga marina TaxID=2494733 RepID=A0A937KAS3_9BACT|nr:M4 family metallopeptidase [Fulvivirga marina]MBL6444977.1 M4 family metallopeptidase [Fulvivirga marina]